MNEYHFHPVLLLSFIISVMSAVSVWGIFDNRKLAAVTFFVLLTGFVVHEVVS